MRIIISVIVITKSNWIHQVRILYTGFSFCVLTPFKYHSFKMTFKIKQNNIHVYTNRNKKTNYSEEELYYIYILQSRKQCTVEVAIMEYGSLVK